MLLSWARDSPGAEKAVVDAIERFGVQVSVARTRVKVDLFPQLEARLNDIMHGAHTLTFNAVTPCHIAVLPLLASGTLPHFTFSKNPILLWRRPRTRRCRSTAGFYSSLGKSSELIFRIRRGLKRLFAMRPARINADLGIRQRRLNGRRRPRRAYCPPGASV